MGMDTGVLETHLGFRVDTNKKIFERQCSSFSYFRAVFVVYLGTLCTFASSWDPKLDVGFARSGCWNSDPQNSGQAIVEEQASS
jgi:hypothetical protein